MTVPFAPEFRDLSDNLPLLEEVSRIAGGRILPADPNAANLYDYAGLSFPETNLPLLRPLMLAWLGLFLLDVAVRRVVIDVRAGLRRVQALVPEAQPARPGPDDLQAPGDAAEAPGAMAARDGRDGRVNTLRRSRSRRLSLVARRS